MPPWRISSAPQEARITRRPGDRALAQRLGDGDHRRDRAQVVGGAGHDLAALDVLHQRRAGGGDEGAGGGQLAAAGGGAGGDHQRPRQQAPPLRERSVDALDDSREALAESALQCRVEDLAGVGGVVVAEDHERALRFGVAELGDDVGRRLLLHHRLAPGPEAVLDVVGDQRRGAGAEERRRACGSGRSRPLGARRRGAGSEPAEHPGEAVVELLVVDRRRRRRPRSKPRRDPLRRLALARRPRPRGRSPRAPRSPRASPARRGSAADSERRALVVAIEASSLPGARLRQRGAQVAAAQQRQLQRAPSGRPRARCWCPGVDGSEAAEAPTMSSRIRCPARKRLPIGQTRPGNGARRRARPAACG